MKRLTVFAMTLSALTASLVGVPAVDAAEEPDTQTFEFNSTDDHGEYDHCVIQVLPSPTDPDVLIPSDETCFTDADEAREFAESGGAVDAGINKRSVFSTGLIAIHYDGLNFTGASLAISGTNCAGGGITFTGGAWTNRIRSTENGCSWIEHYDVSGDFVFTGRMQPTTRNSYNLNRLDRKTSGVLYKGLPLSDSPDRPPLEVVAIEINQALDSWNPNDIPGVSDKTTMVRIFLDSNDIRDRGVLHVSRGGVLLQTLDPINLTDYEPSGMPSSEAAISAMRRNLNSSLNFVPSSRHMDGTVQFTFLPSRLAGCGSGLSGNSKECWRTKTFSPTRDIDIRFIVVEGNEANEKLSLYELYTQAWRIEDIWPTAKVHVTVRNRITIDGKITDDELLRIATDSKTLDINDVSSVEGHTLGNTLYVAVAANALRPDDGAFGVADSNMGTIGVFVQFGSKANTGAGADAELRNLMPHEFGHIVRRNHPNGSQCGSEGGRFYPHLGPVPDFPGKTVALISPEGSFRDRIWGLAPRHRFDDQPRVVIDPGHSTSVMSYCLRDLSESEAGQHMWADAYSYPLAFDNLQGPGWQIVPGFYVALSGEITLTGVLRFAPAVHLEAAIVANSPGDHLLELVDDQGDVVYSTTFATALAVEPPSAFGEIENPDRQAFRVLVQDPPDFATVRVTTPAGEISELTGGAAPTLSIDTPTPGVLNGAVDISWTATDPDTPALEYAVAFSTDGGTTFQTYAVNLTETTLSIPAGMLPSTNNGVIRVTALDGTNEVSATVSGFSTPNLAPVVFTDAPPTPMELDLGEQLTLSADATDPEDGDLTDSVTWTSDIDGLLANGSELSLAGDELTLGQHLISVSVTDSAGAISTVVVTVNVGSLNQPPDIAIAAPLDGAAISDDAASVLLSASTFDPEDGYHIGPVTWSSDVDGPLGTGTDIFVDPSAMTPGSHVLTASVTDAAGLTTTLSVTVTIDVAQVAPTAVDDVATVMGGETIQIDVIANDSDRNGDLDSASLSITTPPTAGTAAVVTVSGATVIEYVAPTADVTDTLVYQICDAGGLCSTATVTITVGFDGCTITGTSGDDILIGTPGDDVICGGEGNDTIDGLGGDDTLIGGPGSDTITGGPGDDIIFGGKGADTLSGNQGRDVIRGGGGADTIEGNLGADELHGGRGQDHIDGNRGHDVIFGGRGHDVLLGGRGADIIRGNRGADVIRGNRGSDELYGGRGHDELYGGRGADELYGRRGDDVLRGGRGADSLLGGRGFDELRGGTGQDYCRSGEQETSCEY